VGLLKSLFYGFMNLIIYALILSLAYLWLEKIYVAYLYIQSFDGVLEWQHVPAILAYTLLIMGYMIFIVNLHMMMFRFDGTFGLFIPSRRRFKHFMLDNARGIWRKNFPKNRRITYWDANMSGSKDYYIYNFAGNKVRYTLIRMLHYILALVFYAGYHKCVCAHPGNLEKAQQAYLGSARGLRLNDQAPLTIRLMMHEDFPQYVTRPYVFMAKSFMVACFMYLSILLLSLIYVIIFGSS
jgi:hypothetical protein